jgi:hypothetical protein
VRRQRRQRTGDGVFTVLRRVGDALGAHELDFVDAP